MTRRFCIGTRARKPAWTGRQCRQRCRASKSEKEVMGERAGTKETNLRQTERRGRIRELMSRAKIAQVDRVEMRWAYWDGAGAVDADVAAVESIQTQIRPKRPRGRASGKAIPAASVLVSGAKILRTSPLRRTSFGAAIDRRRRVSCHPKGDVCGSLTRPYLTTA
jgi:hypothetical protein